MATWTMSTISATYPKVVSIAQSKNTGQYMLAIVTNAADLTDARGRVFQSINAGDTWNMLQDLFPINGNANSSHLNYATLAAETTAYNRAVFYDCAVSDDGKYQSFGQKSDTAYNGMWYSTNYGNTTGSIDEKWKYIQFASSINGGNYQNGVTQLMYSPGPYPVLFGNDVFFRAFTHFTGLTPATGTITDLGGRASGNFFTSIVPALYDNNFTTISRRVVYSMSDGNLYKTTNAGAATNINPSGWPVSSSEGGGIAVSADSNIVVASRYITTTGGLWLSNDGGTNWTQKLVNLNVNAVAMSNDGKYIIAGPRDPTSGIGRFYVSQDFGATWTNQDLAFTGILQKLHITNDGKRAVGAGMKAGFGYVFTATTGYITYTGPMTAAEQRAAGKTVAQLIALSYSTTDIIGAGYSPNELIVAGIVPNWDYYPDSNRLKQSFVKDFIDISGSLVLRNNANLYVHGNTTVNGKLLMNNAVMQTDLSFNKRIFVGGDISMAGNVTIASDVSLNGSVLGCTFNANSIPTSAFAGTIVVPGPDYTKASIIYQQKFQANADVSLNGSTVQATNMTVKGNIVFNDGTKMNTYDDNKSVNYGTPFSIKKTYDITGTNTSVSLPFLRCSADGKYVVVNYGGGTNNATGNTAAETGIDLSQDYGMTFNRIYLTKPVSGTPIYRPYSFIVMSNSGKYILATTYGDYIASEPHKTNTNVIGFSSDGGTTWTTAFINTILNLGTTVAYVNELMIDEITNKIAISVFVGSTSLFTYANNSMSLSGFAVIPTAVPTAVYSQFAGFTRLIGNRYVGINDAASDIVVKDLNGTSITVAGRHPNGYSNYTVAMSLSTNTIYMSGGIANIGTVEYYRLDNLQTTPTLTLFTPLPIVPSGNRVNFCVSESGKYVLCSSGGSNIIQNPILGPRYNIPFTSASDNRLYYSSDYGATFTSIPPVYTVTDHSRVAITDTGRVYILNTNTKTIGITVATASLFKASTFTGLTIKNTLTAGSYVVSSDYRIKNNVAKLDKTFTVNHLRPVKYLQTLINKQQYGLIAHELQQYYPDLVFGEKDGHELQRVNYTGLIAILINEIIQLKREFAELEKKRQIAI